MNNQDKIKKAIKHFQNLLRENIIILNEFEEHLKTNSTKGSSLIYKNRQSYYETALKCLEKQLPYRIDEKYKAINGMTYGTCKCGITYAYYVKYCSECGQRLKWE